MNLDGNSSSNHPNGNSKNDHKTEKLGDRKPKLIDLLHAEKPDLDTPKTLTAKLADAMLNGDEKSKGSGKSSLYKTNYGSPSLWATINKTISEQGPLSFNNFKVIKELGSGDIGSVFLVELKGSPGSYLAMKVMDKVALASRKKIGRTRTEKDILQKLDHPFLPSLYSHFETEKHSSLVMEFCSGGDLHALRQKQPSKRFPEAAARFYAAEVLLSLEYLHMMGIIYRDLKPENILIREDGHIMVSDFDLSMQCNVKPTLVRSASVNTEHFCSTPDRTKHQACMDPVPACMQPSCSMPALVRSLTSKKGRKLNQEHRHQITPLPELLAEPTNAHSLSFVGTYEYLAPEIIKGDGHGSAVDWWTFGIFLYELLHGKTPFKGKDNKETLFNIMGKPLTFPTTQSISLEAKDLITGLLAKNPEHRFGRKRGATEIKQHPFFKEITWPLIRGMSPPEIPKRFKPPKDNYDDEESDFSFF